MKYEFLKEYVDIVENFPVEGISFKDVSKLIKYKLDDSANALIEIINHIKDEIDYVVAIDARGFIVGTAVALKLNKGIVMVRKKGKLPPKTKSITYDLEYGRDILEIKEDIIAPGAKVIIADDVYATGETYKATKKLLEDCGANILGGLFLINLNLNESAKSEDLYSLLKY